MTANHLFERVDGELCFRRSHVSLTAVFDCLGQGMSLTGLLERWPELDRDDVSQALRLAGAALSRELLAQPTLNEAERPAVRPTPTHAALDEASRVRRRLLAALPPLGSWQQVCRALLLSYVRYAREADLSNAMIAARLRGMQSELARAPDIPLHWGEPSETDVEAEVDLAVWDAVETVNPAGWAELHPAIADTLAALLAGAPDPDDARQGLVEVIESLEPYQDA